MEKNNRGTAGAVRSDGRGQPMALLLIRCFAPLETGAAAVGPQRHRFKNLDLVHTDPPTRLVVGGPHETNLRAAKPSARGQKFACLSELSTLEQGREMRQTFRFEAFPTRPHSLVQPRGASKSAACRSLLVFWVEDALPPPVIDVNPPAGKISQITRSWGDGRASSLR